MEQAFCNLCNAECVGLGVAGRSLDPGVSCRGLTPWKVEEGLGEIAK